ncbi:MAG: DUF853 family protein [Deltaproteobacteria bacterium]|nr:DUF853 family protein [Deltaproteobacteria bacterium]
MTMERSGYLILTDMTNVRDFWDTLAYHAGLSLERRGFDGQCQRISLARKIARVAGQRDLEDPDSFFSGAKPEDYADLAERIYKGLFRLYRFQAQEYQDLIRALLLLNSDVPEILNDGKYWQSADKGMGEEATKYGFMFDRIKNNEWFMLGLSWLFSIDGGFSVMAFDQLDSTVKYNSLRADTEEESEANRKILISVSNGFSTLISKAHSCLTVSTFLADSWDILIEKAMRTDMARFDRPHYLSPIESGGLARKILKRRLDAAFTKTGFDPPYPTWPFPAEEFDEFVSISPREMLQKGEDHIKACINQGSVFEYGSDPGDLRQPGPDPPGQFKEIEDLFDSLLEGNDVDALKDSHAESWFWPNSLALLSEIFSKVVELGKDQELVIGDDSRPLSKSYRSFAFFRHYHVKGEAPDRCLSLWAILHDNAKAFQARLNTALSQSGIDKDLSSRRLVVVRFSDPPSGQVTSRIVQRFRENKGIFLDMPDQDLRALQALNGLSEKFGGLFMEWAVWRKPVYLLKSIVPHLEWLLNKAPGTLWPSMACLPPADLSQPSATEAQSSTEAQPPTIQAQPIRPAVRQPTSVPQAPCSDGRPSKSVKPRPPIVAKPLKPAALTTTSLAQNSTAETQPAEITGPSPGTAGQPSDPSQPRPTIVAQPLKPAGQKTATLAQNSVAEIRTPAILESPSTAASQPTAIVGPPPTTEVRLTATAKRPQAAPALPRTDGLLIGQFPARDGIVRLASVKADDLTRHVAIFGGTGSGKTVLMRRIVEEAALAGVPSVVIDISGDLCLLGQPWPEPEPGTWLPGDGDRAARYLAGTETVVWTPGLNKGNPLRFPVIPDLIALRRGGDVDSLDAGIAMAREAITAAIRLKITARTLPKEGVISSALRRLSAYERDSGPTLMDFVELLEDMPDEAIEELGDGASKTARAIAKDLRSAMSVDQDLKEESTADIAGLFRGRGGRTRISVVNLLGLGQEDERPAFVQRLVMNMFSWMTRNPGKGLAGLLVIDEAKDFVPSQNSTPPKTVIQRVANQARKFGYGLILASQAIKSLDSPTVNNCSSVFIGRQSSPSNIDACRTAWGISGVEKLGNGQFMCISSSLGGMRDKPATIDSAMCLSRHPSPAPSLEEIVEIAKKSADMIR